MIVVVVVCDEENILFNDVLNTFYLRLYGFGPMIKDHSESEIENPLPPLHGLLFPIAAKELLYAPSYTTFVIPVVLSGSP